MTLEQPLDKRLFDSEYDDVEILGKLVTRGDYWRPIGFVLHVLRDQRGVCIRWSSGSVLAWARNARPITRRWISLVPSKMV